MENRLKLRLSRMFRSSFSSCRSRNLSLDVIHTDTHKPLSLSSSPVNSQNHNPASIQPIPPHKPRLRPFPSICRPKHQPFYAQFDGHLCPPPPPIRPLTPFRKLRDSSEPTRRSKRSLKKKKNPFKKSHEYPISSSSDESTTWGGWHGSDGDEDREDETETLFSSTRSATLSSDSTESRRKTRRRRCRRGQRRWSERCCEVDDVLPLTEGKGKVEGSFAVVKRSSDPHGDFRTSMVEMIVEKGIFRAADLEQLLRCFLSLNSPAHHAVIVEVFEEIWEALFSDHQLS